jgi:regulator of cell morphogenesis and NO signaling
MLQPRETDIIGDLVASDFRAAGVFERFGIDFCCGGRRSLADACEQAGVDAADVVLDLIRLGTSPRHPEDDVARWSPTRLVTHIVGRHHAYIRSAMPMIGAYLSRLVEVHGARHPELAEVRREFDRLAVELRQHLMKEEQVLFPYILELAEFDQTGATLPPSPFGTIANPIRMMEREHQEAGDELRAIRDLTHGYATPPDGCTTYRVAMAELERFERDLHEHVHLENNVLFPAAVAIEARLGERASAS